MRAETAARAADSTVSRPDEKHNRTEKVNTTGILFRLTTFGESHGKAVGGVVDGMPAGIPVDTDFIQAELSRRRPGQSRLTTPRQEKDEVEILSGVFEGVTTGAPVGFVVRNTGQRPADYSDLKDIFRPSHADYTYAVKYGTRDYRGGGRSSARVTISRCVGGALAKLMLGKYGISVTAYTSEVGGVAAEADYRKLDLSAVEDNAVRCPDKKAAEKMEELIASVRAAGDSVGGVITCVIKGCPAGLGEPEFGKLHARLGAAMLSINAAKGFEYGSGFEGARSRGSLQNDSFALEDGRVTTLTNNSGGIQGGISNGQDIYFRVAFKPTATILMPQRTVAADGHETTFTASGRHDPCVLPRAVPIVEAMAAMVIADNMLLFLAEKN